LSHFSRCSPLVNGSQATMFFMRQVLPSAMIFEHRRRRPFHGP
jgi:hypothetical protein